MPEEQAELVQNLVDNFKGNILFLLLDDYAERSSKNPQEFKKELLEVWSHRIREDAWQKDLKMEEDPIGSTVAAERRKDLNESLLEAVELLRNNMEM